MSTDFLLGTASGPPVGGESWRFSRYSTQDRVSVQNRGQNLPLQRLKIRLPHIPLSHPSEQNREAGGGPGGLCPGEGTGTRAQTSRGLLWAQRHEMGKC